MVSDDEIGSAAAFAAPRELRLHPLSWLFISAASSKGLIGPWILLALFSGGSYLELLSILFIFPAVVIALVRYGVYRYRLGPEEIVIRDGVLTRNERHIPYSRIQNIDLVQNPFHRLFGVALVRLETASGSRPEAVMRVLSLNAVEQLRQQVSTHQEVRPKELSEEETLLEISDLELVRLGLISNRGMLLLAAITGLLWQMGRVDERLEEIAPELFARITGFGGFGVLWALLALLALVVLLRIFSVTWYLFTLRGFRLRLGKEEIRTDYGLLNHISATIPLRRIQLVSAHESPLHRLFDRVSVRLETAGSVGEEGQGSNFDTRTEAPWLAPLLPSQQLKALLQAVQPDIDLAGVEWRSIGGRAQRRLTRKGIVLTMLVTAILIPATGLWALLALIPGVAWALLHAHLYVRHTGYAVADWGVAFKSGWWVRRMSLLRFAKCQSVQLLQTPFDRRHHMASVQADTAGAGKLNHGIDIPYLDIGPAQTLQQRIYQEASRRDFLW